MVKNQNILQVNKNYSLFMNNKGNKSANKNASFES